MRKRSKETRTNRERERERETGIFSMMGFDNATSSFLALLVNKSYSKLKKEKLKTSFQDKNF